MNSLVVFLCVFAVVLIAGFAGTSVRKHLQPHHLNDETKDIVKFSSGFIATMAALVLGLLVASAKSSYDARAAEVEQVAAKAILLDQMLRHYGPEAASARQALQAAFAQLYATTWAKGESMDVAKGGPASSSTEVASDFRKAVSALVPANDAQRAVQARTLEIMDDLRQTRWLFTVQSTERVSLPLLIVLVTWLSVIALCTGLYAPRNGMAATAAVLCAGSVSAAIFLIVEMYSPFDGLLKVSDAPFRTALGYLKQ
jgi:ABC-type multidrug transport system fused ATPase/permease subunit